MKKALLALFLLSRFTAFSQTGLFIKPTIGVGTGNARGVYNGDTKYSAAYKAEVAVGYNSGHIRLETGVTYLHTGCMASGVTLLDQDKMIQGDIRTSEKKLLVPLKAGYVWKAGEKLSIVPSAGLYLSYFLNSRTTFYPLNGEAAVSAVNSASSKAGISATASFFAELKLTPRVALSAGPVFIHELTPFLKGTSIRFYSFIADAGLVYRF